MFKTHKGMRFRIKRTLSVQYIQFSLAISS